MRQTNYFPFIFIQLNKKIYTNINRFKPIFFRNSLQSAVCRCCYTFNFLTRLVCLRVLKLFIYKVEEIKVKPQA